MSTPDRPVTGAARVQRGLAALAVVTFVAAAGLLAQGSCAPAGDTRTPEQKRQPEDNRPDPDSDTVDLSPRERRRLPMT